MSRQDAATRERVPRAKKRSESIRTQAARRGRDDRVWGGAGAGCARPRTIMFQRADGSSARWADTPAE